MNFYDTVSEMGYNVSNMGDIVDISKIDEFTGNDPLGEIHITFYIKEKKILAYIKPTRNIYSVDDVSHLYNILINKMQKDLKFFADKSKYAII